MAGLHHRDLLPELHGTPTRNALTGSNVRQAAEEYATQGKNRRKSCEKQTKEMDKEPLAVGKTSQKSLVLGKCQVGVQVLYSVANQFLKTG